ncbi:MAG: cysteine--tRNA ligase [Candidatus Paceibacterota bacterium]|jgi:cysteinyl-tRNA synthetase|nr:cysteine--tRNA ligase [Candidatus Paceibacterota bacterium]
MAVIKFYNTLTREKDEFKPLHEGAVGMYNCGPTVYHYAHIGNLRAYVFADILRKTLEYNGLLVTQIVNITDVGHLVSDEDEGEDKMEKGAAREGKTAQDIAKFYTDSFYQDLAKLNIEPAARYTKATEHIPEQIALIQKLEEKDFTYRTSDGIYFDTAKFPGYGKLARLDIAGLQEGARVEANEEKKHRTDFALWKFSKPDEKRQQEWESPWGIGFPGWHIECSAMSMKYLGETFDIHTGGIDHIPIHHTNEIAQAECATGKKFVNYWMHSGFVNIEGGKMAKSADNFVRMATLEEKGISPLAYRYWLLTAHYRKTINFTWEAVEGAQTALLKLHQTFLTYEASASAPNGEYLEKLRSFLNDDLETSGAIASLWDLVKDESISPAEKHATFLEYEKVLGLGFGWSKEKLAEHGIKIESNLTEQEIPEAIKKLLDDRKLARAEKNWKRSDEIRDEITKMGYKLVDGSEGPSISKL